MLQTLNSRIQGWFAWIIISVIALTFALFGVEHYMQSRASALAKAEVNGQQISIRDFELHYRRNQSMQDPSETNSVAEQKRKDDIVDQMIMQSLTTQSALSNGFYTTNNQAISAIQSIPQFQQEGHFSIDRYQQALSNALFTPTSFQTEVKEQLLANQQRFAFSNTAFALPNEIEQFVKLYHQTRDYDYLVIPYKVFSQEVKIADKDVDTYYQQHREAYKTPEKVVLEYVRLSMPDIREKVKISDAQVKRYYDDNKSNFVTPAKWHVAHILFALPISATPAEQKKIEETAHQTYELLKKSPAQFDQVAKTKSDDKISALKGGDLPWIVAGQTEFDKVLVNLTTVGEISPPAKTAQGYEIFKLIAYTPTHLKSFDAVKDSIKNQLTLDEVQTKYARALEQLSDLAYQSPDSLGPVAEALNLTIEQTEPFSQEGGSSGLTKNKNILQTAFSEVVLTQGNNSEPVQLDNETVVVVRIAKHIPASEKTLPEVKDAITSLLVKRQAEVEAKHFGETLIHLKNNPDKEKQLLDEHHLKWQIEQKAARNSKSIPDSVNHLAFQSARLASPMGDSLPNGDFVIIRLSRIHDGKLRDLTSEEIARLRQNIESSHGVVDYDLYQKALLSQASITRY